MGRALLKEACAAVDFPEGRIYPLASELTPEQREVAERMVDDESDPHPYAMPSRPAVRRRWLGLAPPGALDEAFGVEPLWRLLQRMRAGASNAYDAAKVMAELLNTMPIARRLRVFADLYSLPEPGAVYDIDGGTLFFHGGLRLVDDIDGSHGKWAAAEADRLVALGRLPPEEIRLVVFIALARAKVKIKPKWDVLLPVLLVWKDSVTECARAIPENRRAAAIDAALEAGHPDHVANAPLELLERLKPKKKAAAKKAAAKTKAAPKKKAAAKKAAPKKKSAPKKKAAAKKTATPKKKSAPKKKAAKTKKPK